MTTIGFLAIGFIIGGVIAWLIASSKAKSVEAVNNELRQQIADSDIKIKDKDDKLEQIRKELTDEKQIRASMDAKYEEAEKNLLTIETWLTDKLGSISLDALSKNSAEFLKLAEEKLKSQTVEGKKELEGKKNLSTRASRQLQRPLRRCSRNYPRLKRGALKYLLLLNIMQT